MPEAAASVVKTMIGILALTSELEAADEADMRAVEKLAVAILVTGRVSYWAKPSLRC